MSGRHGDAGGQGPTEAPRCERAQVVTLPSGLGRVVPAREEADDATEDIMDRLVQSVTQNPSHRQSSPKNRRRSRINRKSRE